MKATRFFSFFLATLMLTSSLFACATEADTPANTDPDETTAATEEDTGPRDNLPDGLDYGGETIMFYQYVDGAPLIVSELNSDPINDSVFERNKYVENRLNVRLANIVERNGDAYTVVNKTVTAVQSGSTDYDVITSPCWVVLDQSLGGTFANMADAGRIELSQPWWTQGFNEAVSFQGNQYVVAGSILLSIYRNTFATVFNKALFTNANQVFPYEYVQNGTWTLDKQISLIPLFHRDNGNATQDELGDYYGLATGPAISIDPYWASCEIDILKKNSDGEYELVFDSGLLYDVAEKVLRLYYETDDSTFVGTAPTVFANGYAAMATLQVLALESPEMRGMTDAYGVVPMPRLTEEQDGYYSLLHDGFTVITSPTTVTNERLNLVGTVLEAMGSASYRIVRPAYYETTLRTKLVSDPQSSEMMDLIMENMRIDAGYIYVDALNSFHHGFREIIAGRVNTATSIYKSKQKATEKMVKQFNAKLTRLTEQNN